MDYRKHMGFFNGIVFAIGEQVLVKRVREANWGHAGPKSKVQAAAVAEVNWSENTWVGFDTRASKHRGRSRRRPSTANPNSPG